jgi:transposase
MLLRPVIVEELIADDHPARAMWEFVGRLDLARYLETVRSLEGVAGRPAIDPQLLVSLWIYSYSRGVSSARAIERLCDHDPAYQWLTGMASINAHTLSDFRVDHADALHDLFVQVLGLLSAEGLITLERVMQDGTKVRANAASSEFRTQGRVEEHLQLARAAVDALATTSEDETNLQRERARARAAREKQERLERAFRAFDELKAASSMVTRVSTTNPDARVMKQADGGTAPSYNVRYDAKYPCDGTMRYRYKAAADTCGACPAKPVCCPRTAQGRSIERFEPLPAVSAFRQKMQTDIARAIYKTRSQIAEFPHLWIKAKLALRQFRVRGLPKVRMEARWAALTYDIQQWIRLRWRPQRSAGSVPA